MSNCIQKKGRVASLVNTIFMRCIYIFTVLIVPYSLNVLLLTNQILERKIISLPGGFINKYFSVICKVIPYFSLKQHEIFPSF